MPGKPFALATSAMWKVLLLTAVASAGSSAPVAADPSGCSDQAECSADDFVALQVDRRRTPGGAKTSITADGASQAEETEWRDAIEAEKKYFERHQSLLQTYDEEVRPKHHGYKPKGGSWKWFGGPEPRKPPPVFKPPSWKRPPVYVGNAQANPQTHPFGPYAHSPFEPYDAPSPLLQRPAEVWSENGILKTTLVVDSAWLEIPGTGLRVRTRLFNGSYPGPTLRVKRGDLVNITMINKLGSQRLPCREWPRREGQATNEFPEGIPPDNPRYQDVGQKPHDPFNMRAKPNNMHDVNVTNLHVHGWHVSPLEPQDNVLDIKIDPGKSYHYSYQLSPYHSSGNSWYHSHWHGSVTAHTNGGMMGALIIDDEAGESPEWIRTAEEIVAVIHEADWSYYGPQWLKFMPTDEQQGCFPYGSTFTVQCALGHRTGLMANLSGDSLYRMEYQKGFGYEVDEKVPITSLFSVNGQYRPTIKMLTGAWYRMRIIFASGNLPMNMIFNQSSPCEMWLIAKDSAWIEEYPRKITRGVFMGAGNRAQIMIRCSKAGTYALHNNVTSYAFSAVDPNQTMMFAEVEGPEVNFRDPTPFKAVRPRYLQSLVDIPDDWVTTPNVPPARNQYNGKPLETEMPVVVDKTITSVLGYDFPGLSPGLLPIPSTAYQHQPVRFVINNQTFSLGHPQASFPVGQIIELEAAGLDTHSWHMHTDPVQYVDFGDSDYKDIWGGYFEIGDWQDVLQLAGPAYDVRVASTTAKVRFQTDCYSGQLVIHCHVLYHEDLGMMTWFNVTGLDHTINPKFENNGIFAHAPPQCLKPGQQCAPAYCTDYRYPKVQ